ncbi:hypothetical protein [Stenotrophomonas forensis]
MRRTRAIPPFITLDQNAVTIYPLQGWELRRSGHDSVVIPDKAAFPPWDSSLGFSLRRVFSVDVEGMVDLLGLGRGAQLSIVARVETARGMFSTVAKREVLKQGEREVEIVIEPDSSKLSLDVGVLMSVVVDAAGLAPSGLSASIAGSRVWQDSWSSKLEGGRRRLPIEVVSFRNLGIGKHDRGLIHVQVADALELDFEQAVCVYVNGDYPGFVLALEKGESHAVSYFEETIIRQVISFSLSQEGDFESAVLIADSAAYQVSSWLAAIYSGRTRAEVAAMRIHDPGEFEVLIQSWVDAGRPWRAAGGKA